MKAEGTGGFLSGKGDTFSGKGESFSGRGKTLSDKGKSVSGISKTLPRTDSNPGTGAEGGIKVYGSGQPVRLFAAGLHGEEWEDTTEILEKIRPPKTGTLVLIPLVSRGEYISTLDPRYYPELGKKVLRAVEELKPEIYIELHSYAAENFEKLAGKDRIDRAGVPAYSVLEAGVLLGSVSPHIRRKYFPKEALCLSFEIEKGRAASREFASRMLEVLKEMETRDEFIEHLKKEFPGQAKKAIEDYRRFYGEI